MCSVNSQTAVSLRIYVYMYMYIIRYVRIALYYKHGTMYKLEYIDGLVFTNIF